MSDRSKDKKGGRSQRGVDDASTLRPGAFALGTLILVGALVYGPFTTALEGGDPVLGKDAEDFAEELLVYSGLLLSRSPERGVFSGEKLLDLDIIALEEDLDPGFRFLLRFDDATSREGKYDMWFTSAGESGAGTDADTDVCGCADPVELHRVVRVTDADGSVHAVSLEITAW